VNRPPLRLDGLQRYSLHSNPSSKPMRSPFIRASILALVLGAGLGVSLAQTPAVQSTDAAVAAPRPSVVYTPPPPAMQGAPLANGAQSWVVGAEGGALTLEDAIKRAKDGDVIELMEGSYRGALLIDNRRLTLRGVGNKPALVQGDGKVVATPALWTIRGGAVTLQNIEFRGARAQDGGGAGVRMEGGTLTVLRCRFFDNEHGLLAINDDKAELVIQGSVFGMAPRVQGGLYHLLNVGRIGKLNITATRFQQGFEGHLIKSRAREAFIGYNFIHDSVRGGASYEIELANGGQAIVIGNVIGQGADSQNRVIVAYGTEGKLWDKNTLHLAHNTIINYGWLPAWFLRVFKDRLPDNTQVYAVNNLIVGPGVFWMGATGQFEGNRHVTLRMLRDAATYGFELPPDSMWRRSGVDPRNFGGLDLSPQGEFEWPGDFRAIPQARTSWVPGAYQR
jgi:hypothetical protein